MTEKSTRAERNKNHGHDPAHPLQRHRRARHHRERNGCRYRQRMTRPQRQQRAENSAAAALLQSKRHREQPAHPGIHSVEGSQSQQRRPRSCHLSHFKPQEKQYESEDASPPSR